ncbi:MAG: HDOD domain-containing protein [Solirubrobacteraceae bacterium]
MSVAATRDEGAPGETEPAPSIPPVPAERRRRRVLFVDDRPDTFEGLREAMRPSGTGWELEFALGGDEALATLAEEPVDVLIVEEEMEAMDGVTLLTRVRDRYPTTIRMIVSATTRPGLAAIVSHRFLSKPCNVAELGLLIKRSYALRARTGQTDAYRRTMATTALPSRPTVYLELNRVLSDPNWQPNQVAAAIERDVALSAKVLQLANSALFGLTSTVTSVRDAVVYLGVDTIKSLALTAEAFGKLAPRSVEGFSIDAFQAHAMLVARITASILPAGRSQQEAVTAALLHDIGKLVMVADGSDRWTQLNRQAVDRGLPLFAVEQVHAGGVTHADLGAHLLSLWGLPDPIVEAVANHHSPGSVPGLAFDGVMAVHIANALANEIAPTGPDAPPPAPLDDELLAQMGLGPRIDLWRHLARQLAHEAADGSAH